MELDNEWDIKHNIKKKNTNGPLRLIKSLPNLDNKKYSLLKFRFSESNESLESKLPANNNFLVLKQKRYKKKLFIKNTEKYGIDPATGKKSKEKEFVKYYGRRNLENNRIFTDISDISDFNSYTLYKCIRNNRKRSDMLPVNLCRRLLRTKRTLVLPAHVNLTIVTNSYDVVHS
jgi:hypothetical protein